MKGFCPKCNVSQSVHRGSWIVGIPECEICTTPLQKTTQARKEVRGRMIDLVASRELRRS